MPLRSYEADVVIRQVESGPSVSVEFHLASNAEQQTLTIRPKGSPDGLAVVVRTTIDGRRTVELLGADTETTLAALRASPNESVRKLAAFLESPILRDARGSSRSVDVIPLAIRAPRSWTRFDASTGVVRRHGSVVSLETEGRGTRRTISVDTTIGVPVVQRVEHADGSLVEVSQQYSQVTSELAARTSASVRMRAKGETTDRVVTMSITNVRLTGGSGA